MGASSAFACGRGIYAGLPVESCAGHALRQGCDDASVIGMKPLGAHVVCRSRESGAAFPPVATMQARAGTTSDFRETTCRATTPSPTSSVARTPGCGRRSRRSAPERAGCWPLAPGGRPRRRHRSGCIGPGHWCREFDADGSVASQSGFITGGHRHSLRDQLRAAAKAPTDRCRPNYQHLSITAVGPKATHFDSYWFCVKLAVLVLHLCTRGERAGVKAARAGSTPGCTSGSEWLLRR
jgi:hypothetical protein